MNTVKINKTRARSGGVTLFGIMILVTVLSMLSLIAVPAYLDSLGNAKEAGTIKDMKAITARIEVYKLKFGTYPSSLFEIGCGEKVDTWGYGFEYTRIDEHLARGYEKLDNSGRIRGGNPEKGTISGVMKKRLEQEIMLSLEKLKGSKKSRVSRRTPKMPFKRAGRLIRKNTDNTPLNQDYDLYSVGPDGKSHPLLGHPASKDDIVRVQNKRFKVFKP